MSRRDGRPATVACDLQGCPESVLPAGRSQAIPIQAILSHWREWFGALNGEAERDVWRVQTPWGICEMHCVRAPAEEEDTSGEWSICRWED